MPSGSQAEPGSQALLLLDIFGPVIRWPNDALSCPARSGASEHWEARVRAGSAAADGSALPLDCRGLTPDHLPRTGTGPRCRCPPTATRETPPTTGLSGSVTPAGATPPTATLPCSPTARAETLTAERLPCCGSAPRELTIRDRTRVRFPDSTRFASGGRTTQLSSPARLGNLRTPRTEVAGRVCCSAWFGKVAVRCQ